MDAFTTSTLTVALAEMGDKTQLLALLLATRFSNKTALIAGILAATLLNHGLSAWLGVYIRQLMSPDILTIIVAVSFIAVGCWLLVPDKDEETGSRFDRYGAFPATFILFFLAELGDKTQVATVVLGAEFGEVGLVTAGTTLGMLLANVPVIYLGRALVERIPVRIINRFTALLFIALGIAAFI